MAGLSSAALPRGAKLSHGRCADPQRGRDLRISETLHPEEQAALLLFRQTLYGAMKVRHPLPLDERGFHIRLAGDDLARRSGSYGGCDPGLARTLSPKYVRHPENPRARVLNLHSLAQCDVKTQKNFLRGFLQLAEGADSG